MACVGAVVLLLFRRLDRKSGQGVKHEDIKIRSLDLGLPLRGAVRVGADRGGRWEVVC